MKNITALVMLLLSTPITSYSQQSSRLESPEYIPIHAWLGPPVEQTNNGRYKELAEAGFTHSFSNFPNADAMEKALYIAKAAGIKLFVNVPELKQDTEGIVNRFKNHPANAGYYLRDEPNAADFTGLAEWVKRVRAFDDSRFCYINLFPNYASEQQLGSPSYREHVSTFIKTVPVKVLSFDHYPITQNGIRPEWFENLEIIADAAKKAKKPFWAFALAVAHGPYPIPSLSDLKLQVYSNLAYGAQGIQYFTYWTPESKTWDFHDGPIDANGKRTVVYRRIKQINSEIRSLSGVFLGARVLSVGHAGELPRGTKPYKVMSPFEKIDPIDNNAVVSWLENGGKNYLVVVNRQLDSNMHLHLELEPGREVLKILKTGDLSSISGIHDIIITPGDAAFFTW